MAEPTDLKQAKTTEAGARFFWVGLIVTLLGGQVSLLLVMTYIATSDASFAIEPDYYQKGLNWDETAAQIQHNTDLGWSLKFTLGEEASTLGERLLQCQLTDEAGRELPDAVIDMVAFPHVRGEERATVTLLPSESGGYEGALRFNRSGLWEFRFVVQCRGETFTYAEQRHVYPPGETRPWRP